MSPIAAHLDALAASWVVDLLGLPPDAVASFCAGASIANLTAIITGRDTLLRRIGWDTAELLVAFGDDARTDAVIARVQASGDAWMGGTTWQGKRAMRISVSDTSTTDADIDRAITAIRTATREM